jgi:hypothetical protein
VKRWPNNHGIAILFDLGTRRTKIDLPERSASGVEADATSKLGSMEAKIIEALEELAPGENLKGEELAQRVGRTGMDGDLKAAVRFLKLMGRIVSSRDGYSLVVES